MKENALSLGARVRGSYAGDCKKGAKRLRRGGVDENK